MKLLAEDDDLYVLAQSRARVDKERAMRKRQLKWLWARLAKLAHMHLTRESLLMKLGAARAKAPAAWRLLDITVDPRKATFAYALNRKKLRQARRREGRSLLRTNMRGRDPAELWRFYIQLVEVDIDQTWRLSRIKGWRVWVDVGKQGATEWQGCGAGGFDSGDRGRVCGDEFVEDAQHFDRAAA